MAALEALRHPKTTSQHQQTSAGWLGYIHTTTAT
jgi:hypothetical protein